MGACRAHRKAKGESRSRRKARTRQRPTDQRFSFRGPVGDRAGGDDGRRERLPRAHRRRPSAHGRRFAPGGARGGAGRGNRSRARFRQHGRGAGRFARHRSRAARPDHAGRARIFWTPVPALGASVHPGHRCFGQRRARGHPPLHGIRRRRLHSENQFARHDATRRSPRFWTAADGPLPTSIRARLPTANRARWRGGLLR